MVYLSGKDVEKKMRLILACLLVFTGSWGLYYGIRAAIAQTIYYNWRYERVPETIVEHDADEENVQKTVILKERYYDIDAENALHQKVEFARRLYPHNYYFPMFVAHNALKNLQVAETREAYQKELARARYFCETAMAINPYQEQVRKLYAVMLAESDQLDAAIAYWETVVDREFWFRSNHDFLAFLYLKSSDPAILQKAVQELPHVSDPDTRQRLRRIERMMKK